MMSIKGLGKAGTPNAKGKFPLDYLKETELSKVAYYHGDGTEKKVEHPPQWVGKGALKLGLSGDAGDIEKFFGQLDSLGSGFHPSGKGGLVKGAGDRHRVGHDITFSAPKDVSVLWAAADEATRAAILEAHQKAVDRAVSYLEKHAITRLGKDGVIEQHVDGLVCAKFQHFASRELDPQLHTHALVLNLAARQDGGWGTLESKVFFDHRITAGAVYQSELASLMAKIGFEAKPEGKSCFAIEGVDDDIKGFFSARRAQIQEELKRTGGLSALAAQYATLATRKEKAEPPLSDLKKAWEAQAKDLGLGPAEIARMIQIAQAKPKGDFTVKAADCGSVLTQEKSTFLERDLLRSILGLSMGRWDADRCEKEMLEMLKSEDIIALGKDSEGQLRYTTKEMRMIEVSCAEGVKGRLEETAHIVRSTLVDKVIADEEARISKEAGTEVRFTEQRTAIEHICLRTGGYAFIEGDAGTGKTTMLKAVNDIYSQSGIKTIGCALAGKAASGLANEAGIPSQTLDSLLRDLDGGTKSLDAKTVVVLDEAGMVGSRMFARLQSHVDRAGAKLVAVGDPKQLQAIEAGGMMRSLMNVAGKARLQDIQRQRTDTRALRAALKGDGSDGFPLLTKKFRKEAQNIRSGKRLVEWAENLAKVDPRVAEVLGEWREKCDYEWMREAVKDFAADGERGRGRAGEALRKLEERGLLAVSNDARESGEKMVADWLADENAFKNKIMLAGNKEEVFLVNSLAREALAERGEIDPKRFERIFIGDSKSAYRDFCAGDRILFTRNNKKIGVMNGNLGVVEAFERSKGKVYLRCRVDTEGGLGKVVRFCPKDYGSVDHGYCVTVHKSQGVTINNAYAMLNEGMADREWTYVAASRSRFRTKLYAVEGDVSHLLSENHHKLDKAEQEALEREAQLKQMGSRMGKSRAKDTSLDYPAQKPQDPEAESKPKTKRAEPEAAPAIPRKGHFRPDGAESQDLAKKAREQERETREKAARQTAKARKAASDGRER